jgi:hypothetical protein
MVTAGHARLKEAVSDGTTLEEALTDHSQKGRETGVE